MKGRSVLIVWVVVGDDKWQRRDLRVELQVEVKGRGSTHRGIQVAAYEVGV